MVELDLTNLAEDWEREDAVRAHLRTEGATLLGDKDVCESVKTCVVDHVHAMLKVMCLRMAETEGAPQPAVAPLREELEKLYKRCGVMVDEKIVFEDSWMVRKLCCFLKMKTRKRMVSTVTCHVLRLGPHTREPYICKINCSYICFRHCASFRPFLCMY